MDVEKAMDDVIKKVQNELIPEREFQKLRNQVENDFITKNSRMAGISESLAQYAMYYGDANLINTELERYLSVTREDIQRVAKQYFDTSKRVSLYYLAKPNTP
jgi:zinc protease